MIEILKIIFKEYRGDAFILSITLVGAIFLFKKSGDEIMKNEFDKMLIPKTRKKLNEIVFNFSIAVIFNAFLTMYAFTVFEGIESIKEYVKLVSILLVMITYTMIMFNLLFKFILKKVLSFFNFNSWLFNFLKSIVVYFKDDEEKEDEEKIEDELENKLSKIVKKYYSIVGFINFFSMMLIYLILLPESYDGLSLKAINVNVALKLIIRFGLSSIIIFGFGMLYRWGGKLLFDNYLGYSNNAKYKILISNEKDIDENELYFFYLIDKNKMVLGDKISYEKSDFIYLYEKDKDKYIQFEKIKD